jgi:hypothetical protein
MHSGALRDTPLGLLFLCLSVDGQNNDDLPRRLTAPDANWPQLLRIAGNHLVTPTLACALQRRQILDQQDTEVRDYLEGIQSLNLIRNEALRSELLSIARELNDIGITPVLIKGAIALLPEQYPGATHRIMGDLDIVVPDERMNEAHVLLSTMGYGPEPDAQRWQTAAEKRSGAHITPMQHRSLPVSVELHRRMLSNPADDLALGKGCELQPIVLPDGTIVSIPDPASRLVHSFVHSQISHRLGIRRLINLRHLHEFACLANHYRANIAQEAISSRLQPRRRPEFAEYCAIAEDWLGAPFPSGLLRSPAERSAILLTERVMTNTRWRKAFTIWGALVTLPRRLVMFGLKIWEMPEYLPVRIRRLIAESR